MGSAKRKGTSNDLESVAKALEQAKVEFEMDPSQVSKLVLVMAQQRYSKQASTDEYEARMNTLTDALKSTDDRFERKSLKEKMKKLDETHDMIMEKLDKDLEITGKMLGKMVH